MPLLKTLTGYNSELSDKPFEIKKNYPRIFLNSTFRRNVGIGCISDDMYPGAL